MLHWPLTIRSCRSISSAGGNASIAGRPPRQEFLCGCLSTLAQDLERKGGRLIIRQGAAERELEELVRGSGATAIYFNRDPDPSGRAMEEKIAAMGTRVGVAVHALKDHALHEREEVLTAAGQPYRVFTPYARAWHLREKLAPRPGVARLSTPAGIATLPLPTLATWELTHDAEIITPGEAAARKRLANLIAKIAGAYGDQRNLPAQDATSRISQDLRHGLLSVREVWQRLTELANHATAAQRRNVEIFINELVWREFYMQVLWFRPDVLEQEYQPETRGLAWRTDDALLDAWKTARTGFPIIDAGMRQLRSTGFLHNRVRMIVAMFLTKDLHISWKEGEQWFMQRLVDAEIASNNGGWQWSASTGTDAAPYFRIQNPWTQAKRFDPDGEYIRRWLPELRDVPARRLFIPPPPDERLARNYPPPVVDHARERDVTLEMFRR